MKEVKIVTEHITLGQLIKLLGLVDSGAMVKTFVQEEKIFVNNEKETRRGRKLYPNDVIRLNNTEYIIQ